MLLKGLGFFPQIFNTFEIVKKSKAIEVINKPKLNETSLQFK